MISPFVIIAIVGILAFENRVWLWPIRINVPR
jgi:hypothetical protein